MFQYKINIYLVIFGQAQVTYRWKHDAMSTIAFIAYKRDLYSFLIMTITDDICIWLH